MIVQQPNFCKSPKRRSTFAKHQNGSKNISKQPSSRVSRRSQARLQIESHSKVSGGTSLKDADSMEHSRVAQQQRRKEYGDQVRARN